MSLSVVVPSYGRPESLRRCLDALAEQTVPAEEIVVVVRADDQGTRALVSEMAAAGLPGLHEQIVEEPGQIGALAAGCSTAKGDLVAITDDDAAPRPEWIEGLRDAFTDPAVVGAGGRDVVAGSEDLELKETVGIVRWWGKVIGNHHLGVGPAREVDVLKGVNMAYRRDLLLAHGFDRRLTGNGAQVHNDLMLSLAIRRDRGRLIYDPDLLVDHMPAPRPEGDHRNQAGSKQQVDAVHNETLALLEYLSGVRRAAFVVWALSVGRGSAPGLVHTAWNGMRHPGAGSWRHLAATLRGRRAGWRTFRRSSRRVA